ncbi:MAG: DUF2779 domain-containing protein [Spirochaetia bacterium]|nr:DUF2779 domain-containing protein [Spirochaetia bacterium]
MAKRYLTKTAFIIAQDCPAKLFYYADKSYYDKTSDDEFLKSLAEGGYQVGALAKAYYPEGIEITEKSREEAAAKTARLLQLDNCVIFEAALLSGDCLVRVDVLVKRGNRIRLIEVKAKSYSGSNNSSFYSSGGKILPEWEHYLLDISFQTFVARGAYPNFSFSSYLMLSDKESIASVSSLNNLFKISRDENGRVSCECAGKITPGMLGSRILREINVDEEVSHFLAKKYRTGSGEVSFGEYADYLSSNYVSGKKIFTEVGKQCRECQYDFPESGAIDGYKSGFRECWKDQKNLSENDFSRPFIFDIWNFRKHNELLDRGIFFIDQISDDIFLSLVNPESSNASRQLLQIRKKRENDKSTFFNREVFKNYREKWKYPLHFIDFETSTSAIPFFRGQRPYELTAFQFSHHVIEENGKVRHAGQFISFKPGEYPNISFVKSLKKELENDDGTIFRYSHHENTVLNNIYDILSTRQGPAAEVSADERNELMNFISSVTTHNGAAGERTMVDMCEIVRDCYYQLSMGGSNSIKAVLPAVLDSSTFLKDRYSSPVYGNDPSCVIYSPNWKAKAWIEFDNSRVINPYSLLEPVHLAGEDFRINQGGAASAAWAKMQNPELSEESRESINDALLKYCELDTLAMVMIMEHWMNLGRSL